MDFITNENSLPKQVVINKDNIEVLQTNMVTVIESNVEALTAASEAYDLASSVEGIASEAKSIAESVEGTADEAKSLANDAYNKAVVSESAATTAIQEAEMATSKAESAYDIASSVSSIAESAVVKADEAIATSAVNTAAIEALGDLDAEAIANLQSDVAILQETSEKQEIEISTVVAQVDAAEDDITNMKVDIANNAAAITEATGYEDYYIDVSSPSSAVYLEPLIGKTFNIDDYSGITITYMAKTSSSSTNYNQVTSFNYLWYNSETVTGSVQVTSAIRYLSTTYGFNTSIVNVSSATPYFTIAYTQVNLGTSEISTVLGYGLKVVVRLYKKGN